MGASFTGVRVYDTPFAHEAAKQLHAHAFAVGRDVFFAAGQYRPGTPQGDRLLAHELTHVQQFQTGRLAGLTGVSRPTDPHERAAAANESVVLGNLASLRTDAPQLPTLAVTSRDRLALPTLSSRTSSAPASTAPTLVTTVTKETNAPITITLHPTINITIAGDAAQGGKDVGLYKRTADGIVASVLTALDSQSVKAKIRKVVS